MPFLIPLGLGLSFPITFYVELNINNDFVSEIMQESEKRCEETTWDHIPLAALIQEVARHMGISSSALLSQSRGRNISRARAIISYLAAKESGQAIWEKIS